MCVFFAESILRMPVPVVNVYPNHKTLPTISYIFHTIISLSNICFLHFLAPVPVCLKRATEFYFLPWPCWCSADTSVCASHNNFSSWILKYFLLPQKTPHHSLPLSFSSSPNFTPFHLSSPTTWHCNAGFRNGNEMHRGTVSKSSRLNISLNGPANVCIFFLFKLAQNIGTGAKGAERAPQWTPALLTPHDVFMCLGVIAWIITSMR